MAEDESAALREYLADQGSRRVSSALLRTESLRAVRHLGPPALANVRAGLQRVDLIGIDDRILETAGTLEPLILRTLDAIHVASALAVGDDLEAIVTFDEQMLAAAEMVGLATATPR